MRRRDFIALLGSSLAGVPLAARAQQAAMAFIGLLSGAQLDDRQFRAIREGLKETGYIEGRNIAVKYLSADGRFEQLPALAAELVADAPGVIVAIAPPAALAVKAATATIPIVFTAGADPVDLGLVSSLNRPDGNLTGVYFLFAALAAKRLELLREMVPSGTVIGLLINPANPASEPQTRDVRAAVGALGLELLVLNASSESDIEAAFASFVERRVDGVIVGSDPLFLSRRDQVVALAARRAIPAVHYLREFAVAGGLMSYGTSLADAFRLAGSYAGRILKGGKPADLPVVQAVKFELVLNLKTAKGARVSGAGQIARGCRRGD